MLTNIIEKYSIAFLSLNKHREKAQKILQELEMVHLAFASTNQQTELLANPQAPKYKVHKLVNSIRTAWEKQGVILSREGIAFLKVVIDNGHLYILGKIVDWIRSFYNKTDGIVVAEIESATEITVHGKKRIHSVMSKKYPKNTVQCLFKINKKLLHGAVFRVGDKVLDLSLRYKLLKIRKEFCN